MSAGRVPEKKHESAGKSGIEEVERIVIEETLNMNDGDRRKAAEILGISYKTLYNKTKKYKGGKDEDDEEPTARAARESSALGDARTVALPPDS